MGDERRRRALTRRPRPRLITAVLAFAGMSASFMQTLVIPIQSELPDLLGASKDDTAWVVTVTLLAGAIVTPISGRLGDLFGKRRIVVVLLVALVIGSAVAALSTSLGPLLVGRALQGAAVGVIPLGISILRDVLHPDRLGGGVALVSATLGVGGALGLPISALIAENADWHSIFWLSFGLGIVDIVLVLLIVPPSTLITSGRFDYLGAVGLTVGLSGVLLAISKGSDWGWASLATLGAGIGGLLVLVAWGVYELRTRSPLVDLRVAARPAVLRTNLASIALGFALFGSNVALPQLLELPVSSGVGLGQSLLTASLVMMPSGLVMMALAPVSARLSRTIGSRALLVIGALVVLLSYLVSLVLMTEVWHLLIVAILIGVGIGLGYAAMPTLIMQAVPSSETAAANGLNTLMRSLGTTSAAAVVGTVLASLVVSVDGVDYPTLTAFRVVFTVGAAAALACAILAFTIPKRSHYSGTPALPSD